LWFVFKVLNAGGQKKLRIEEKYFIFFKEFSSVAKISMYASARISILLSILPSHVEVFTIVAFGQIRLQDLK
jgi:hypothetical protein